MTPKTGNLPKLLYVKIDDYEDAAAFLDVARTGGFAPYGGVLVVVEPSVTTPARHAVKLALGTFEPGRYWARGDMRILSTRGDETQPPFLDHTFSPARPLELAFKRPPFEWRAFPKARTLHAMTIQNTGGSVKCVTLCNKIVHTNELVDNSKLPRCKECDANATKLVKP